MVLSLHGPLEKKTYGALPIQLMRFSLNSPVMTVVIGSYKHNYSKDLGVEQNV